MEGLIATKERGRTIYSFTNERGERIGTCSLQREIEDMSGVFYRVSNIDISLSHNNEESLEAMIQSIIRIIAIDTQGQSFSLRVNNDPSVTIHPQGKSMPFSRQYVQGES
jgi:hypothetical protein